ncbi:Uncharacterized protein TOPH_08667 [Tolypocladium ophioglossoides CBS 100239]|uniref:T6SS Phospholipase effector Tle1-like catalytic domain-containing protein n=1 Tax=Tolypocladium ophioglossoides (strain CBS 100239) TaxID=1163406 RepID=A0A0L0MXR0_TOLOC|nr:Uncharacterized protein TOPH_08667 [Tolypocladium ophioglossoides CBS 100239]
MPYVQSTEIPLGSSMTTVVGSEQAQEPKKLVLCFDGTGNSFSGSNADTNVVKLLNKLDRNHPQQHHYYQTGIGRYDINEHSVNQSLFGKIRSSISQTADKGFGTTFDAHVIAGYRFLMRYYESGDKIYVFGFSRGAYTAKFLARMIYTVGLLCMGNEEMVPFAYLLYQRFLAGKIQDAMDANPKRASQADADGDETEPPPGDQEGAQEVHHGHKYRVARDEITAFSNTFCRKEMTNHCGHLEENNIKVYFLGIWDCVNSVAVLERKASIPVTVKGTAQFIRHAVAVDERRVKFKVALLAQDIRSSDPDQEDIKEVWFPGCHGDVGGGWPAVAGQPLDNNERMTVWQRFKNFWTTRKAKEPSKDVGSDPFQMSDVPLAWMIRELELVGQKDPSAAVKWSNNVNGFKRRFEKKKEQALSGVIHDSLRFGHGTGFFTVLLWKLLEWIPFGNRWELEGTRWVSVSFPPNMGDTRNIPSDAVLHESLVWRLRNDSSYRPSNNHGEWSPPCLKHKDRVADVDLVPESEGQPDPDHQTYVFAKSTTTDNSNGV